jgi:hypothetical protein
MALVLYQLVEGERRISTMPLMQIAEGKDFPAERPTFTLPKLSAVAKPSDSAPPSPAVAMGRMILSLIPRWPLRRTRGARAALCLTSPARGRRSRSGSRRRVSRRRGEFYGRPSRLFVIRGSIGSCCVVAVGWLCLFSEPAPPKLLAQWRSKDCCFRAHRLPHMLGVSNESCP